MPEARTLASLTEQFLGGGATAGAKSRTCWGCLKPESPGWYSNTQKKVVCPMENDPTCKARADASRALLVKKIKARSKSIKSKKTKRAPRTATLTKDIAAALRISEETPAPTTPVAGATAVPPIIQVPQGPPPQFNVPIPGAQSVADQSFAASQNYYGNAAAYATGAFNPATTSQSVLGFHPGPPYHVRQKWSFPPQGPGYGRRAGGANQMFLAMILQTNSVDKT